MAMLASGRAIRYVRRDALPEDDLIVPYPTLTFGRAAVMAGLIALALGGCGRKGPLEPPPNARAIDLPDNRIGASEATVPSIGDASPLARAPKTNRAVTIPESSFVLDPLL